MKSNENRGFRGGFLGTPIGARGKRATLSRDDHRSYGNTRKTVVRALLSA
jgi:hypothetical protein